MQPPLTRKRGAAPGRAVAGWSTELQPSTKQDILYRSVDEREYLERMSQGEALLAGASGHLQGEREGGNEEGAAHAAPRGGLQPLPPRPATSSKSQQGACVSGEVM
jgi:hypothetical protein